MKIYNRLVLDINTWAVLEEDSFEYNGPLALCGGSGGSQGTTTTPPGTVHNFEQIFDGETDSNMLNYAATDAMNAALADGGNPYTGEKTYNPLNEMAEMQERFDEADIVVSALAYEADWEGMVDSAVSKLSAVGLSSATDLGTTIDTIVSNSLDHALSVIGSSKNAALINAKGLYQEARANVEEALHEFMVTYASADGRSEAVNLVAGMAATNPGLVATATGTIVAESLSDSDSLADGAVSGALDDLGAIDGVLAGREQMEEDLAFGIAKDEATNSTGLVANAMDDIDDSVESLVGVVEAANKTRANTAIEDAIANRVNSVKDAVGQSLSEAQVQAAGLATDSVDIANTLVETLVDSNLTQSQADALSAGGSIQDIAETDSGTLITSVRESGKDFGNELASEAVLGVDGDSETVLGAVNTANKVRASANVGGSLRERHHDIGLNVQAGLASAYEESNEYVGRMLDDTDGESAIDTSHGNALTNVGSEIDAAKAQAKTLNSDVSILAKVDSEALYNQTLSKGSTDAASKFSTIKSDVLSALTSDLAQADSEVLGDIKALISDIYAKVIMTVDGMMDQAALAADRTANTAIVSNMRTAFATRKMKDHMRAVSRFTGGMADYNAVNASSFIIGMALLESEYADSVDSYDAEISFKVFSQALDGYINTFSSMYNANLSAYVQEIGIYFNAIASSQGLYSQIFGQLVPMFLESYLRMIPEYIEAYRIVLPTYSQSAQSITDMRSGMTRAVLDVHQRFTEALTRIRVDATGQAVAGEIGVLNSLNEIQIKMIEALVQVSSITASQSIDGHLRTVESSKQGYLNILNSMVNTRTGTVKDVLDIYNRAALGLTETKISGMSTLAGMELSLLSSLNSTQIDTLRAMVGLSVDGTHRVRADRIGLHQMVSVKDQQKIQELINSRVRMIESINAMQAQMTNELNARQTDYAGALASTGINAASQMFASNLDLYIKSFVSVLDNFKTEFLASLENQVRTNLTFDSNKNQFVLNGLKDQAGLQATQVSTNLQAAQTQVEIDRIKAVAFLEENTQNLQIDIADAKWDLEVFQAGANIVSCWAGAVVPSQQPGLTATQSVLGGAFAGASIGATVGAKSGNPWFAIGGALIGGALGAIK